MRNRILTLTLLALVACSQTPASPPPAKSTSLAAAPRVAASPFYLYRPVRVLGGTNVVDWSRISFAVGGNPATLGLFSDMTMDGGAQPPCWLRIQVMIQGNPPPVAGASATVPAPNPGPIGANSGPWAAIFDNNPAGHWSIAKDQIAPPGISNDIAGFMAGAAFKQMLANGDVVVLNGANLRCTA